MADISDVENGLAALVADVLYPAGAAGVGGYGSVQAGGWDVAAAYGNSIALLNSIAGLPVRIYRGWGNAQQIDRDMAAGIAHLTVFHGRNSGRLGDGSLDPDIGLQGPAPTIAAAVSGNLVTLTGTATAGNLVGLLVDGWPVVYAVQSGDNLMSIAVGLAAMISGGGIVTTQDGMPVTDNAGNPISLGETVAIALIAGGVGMTISTTIPIIARVGSIGQTMRRTRQQVDRLMLTCWAPTPAARDAICSTVDGRLSDLRWMQLADQRARVLWAGSSSDDITSKAALWRRDINYLVTYWTTSTRAAPGMLFGQINTSSAGQLSSTIA
jgi:hypothetical protein